MKKLYRVTKVAYVYAEDEEAAKMAGDDGGWDIDVEEATHVQKEWLDAIPYGSDEMTCREIWEKIFLGSRGKS